LVKSPLEGFEIKRKTYNVDLAKKGGDFTHLNPPSREEKNKDYGKK